jgi:hypothetical protein
MEEHNDFVLLYVWHGLCRCGDAIQTGDWKLNLIRSKLYSVYFMLDKVDSVSFGQFYNVDAAIQFLHCVWCVVSCTKIEWLKTRTAHSSQAVILLINNHTEHGLTNTRKLNTSIDMWLRYCFH